MSQLFMNQPLENFGQTGQNGNMFVAVWVSARASFEERKNHGRFPVKGEYRLLNWQVKRVWNGAVIMWAAILKKSLSDPADVWRELNKFIQDFQNHNILQGETIRIGWLSRDER